MPRVFVCTIATWGNRDGHEIHECMDCLMLFFRRPIRFQL